MTIAELEMRILVDAAIVIPEVVEWAIVVLGTDMLEGAAMVTVLQLVRNAYIALAADKVVMTEAQRCALAGTETLLFAVGVVTTDLVRYLFVVTEDTVPHGVLVEVQAGKCIVLSAVGGIRAVSPDLEDCKSS